MKKIIKWFSDNVLPFIMAGAFIVLLLSLMVFAVWFDKVRFVF